MKYLARMFEESRVVRKVPGGTPGEWQVLSQTKSIEDAINQFVRETGAILVSSSPPGFHVQWLDAEMTTRAVIVAVLVTYSESVDERSQPTADDPTGPAPPPEAHAPTGSRNPASGYSG